MADDGMIFWLAPDGATQGAPDGRSLGGWLRVVGGHVVQRGEGGDWRAATGLVALPAGETAMLVVPAADAALHWIICPGMTVRQGAAAAPLMAIEGSIGPADGLHAATLPAIEPEQPHIVAIASRDAMERWIGWCEAAGVPNAAIVPAALLLPSPEEGFTAGRIGGEAVLRGTDCALPGNEPYADMIVADAPLHMLDDATAEQGLAAALATPPLNLRQGGYALRRPNAIDPIWLRRVAAMVGFVALATLLIGLVTITRLNMEASALDADTLALARDIVPEASDAGDAETRLAGRLAAAGGGSGGFTGITSAVVAAMQGAPGVTMTSLSQLADGTVRVQLAAATSDEINVALLALQNAGWRIAANGVQQQGAQTIADISVVPS